MLMLVFNLGDERYALESQRVVEIVPLATLKKLTQVPKQVVGILQYRGMFVPVIDLKQVIQGEPCQLYFSTRIILVRRENLTQSNGAIAQSTSAGQNGSCLNNGLDGTIASNLLGIVAERVVETVAVESNQFVTFGGSEAPKRYFRDLITYGQDMMQCVQVEQLFVEANVVECY